MIFINHTKVISLADPPVWHFFDCVIDGKNVVEDWYASLSSEAQFTFNSLLKNHQRIESVLNWTGFKYLKGRPKEERIWQLDFIADKRQYRLLGVFGTQRKSAVLILGCYHKGPNYTPPDALETARKRAMKLREGKAETYERKIRTDI